MSKVFVFEKGECGSVSTKNEFTVNVDILYEFINGMNDTDDIDFYVDEFINNSSFEFDVEYFFTRMKDDLDQTNEMLVSILAGETGFLQFDESDAGIGHTPQEAKLAYADGS